LREDALTPEAEMKPPAIEEMENLSKRFSPEMRTNKQLGSPEGK